MSEKEARRDALDLAVRESGRRCGERRGPAGGYLRQPGGRRELAGRELARAARQRRGPGDALRRQPQAVRPDVPAPRELAGHECAADPQGVSGTLLSSVAPLVVVARLEPGGGRAEA